MHFPELTYQRDATVPVPCFLLFLCFRKVTREIVGDIPNRYTSDVVLNQQARVAHQGWYGGFAIPGGPVAEVGTAVPDAGAYGGSGDWSMVGYKREAYGGSGRRPMAGDLVAHV
jgi:hypothetical protein